MEDKFIIIADSIGEVLDGCEEEDRLQNCAAIAVLENDGDSEGLLIYKLYATVLPIKIKVVDDRK